MNVLSHISRISVAFSACFLLACGNSEETETIACEDDCFLPRAPVCDGDRAYTFSIPGECVDGQCVFPFTITDCSANGGSCSNGSCVAPPDPCDGVACDSPPDPTCDGDIVVTSTAPGTCDEGACSYTTSRSDCVLRNQICEEGRCVTPVNLCAGIICDDAPDNTCQPDSQVAVRYTNDGTCDPATGECSYPETTEDCAESGEFCNRGRCVTVDPCDGISCNTPDSPTCVDNVAVSYAPRGTCSSGECSYLEIENDCGAQICDAGACRDPRPCEGVVCDSPPEGECLGDTLVFYEGPGTCSDNVCSYQERTQDCTATGLVCRAGACIEPDPCENVDCRVNPPGSCEDNVQVRFRDGVCVEGTCEYTRVAVDCAESGLVCLDGACESDDPCLGITCRSPQAPYCNGAIAVVEAATGTCRVVGESFVCDYAETTDDCSTLANFECQAGTCVFVDPCIGVVCEPLESSCEAATNTFIEYGDGVECVDGECDYLATQVRIDCDDIGGLCVSGTGCVAPGELLAEGDLSITEIYVSNEDGSPVVWIEVFNPYANEQRINGLEVVLATDSNVYSHTVIGDVRIAAFGSLVISVEDYGIAGAYSMNQPDFLAALAGLSPSVAIRLTSAEEIVAEVLPVALGLTIGTSSLQLDPGASLPTAPESWCPSVDIATFGLASPGTANHACASRIGGLPIFISEVMPDGPALPFGDDNWFEILNQTTEIVNLRGVDIYYGPPSSAVPEESEFTKIRVSLPFNLPANGGRNLVANTSINVGGVGRFIADLSWNPVEGQLILKAGNAELSRFEWGSGVGITVVPSSSIEIDATSENLGPPFSPSAFCISSGEYGSFAAANGTPGFGPVCGLVD